MNGQCLDRVRAARGVEPAGRRQGRRDPPAVEPQHEHQHPGYWASPVSRVRPPSQGSRGSHCRLPGPATGEETVSRRNAPPRSSPSAPLLAPADAGNARTTTSAPPGSAPNRHRIRWRNRRCTRCRTTAPPTVRPTTKPTRGGTSASPDRARCTTTEPHAARRPRFTAVAKSSRRVSRAAAGSNGGEIQERGTQADNSRRQLTATFEAPRSDDGAPGPGAHPQPEPVSPRAATVVRLERALALGHGCRSPGTRCSVLGAGSQLSGLRAVGHPRPASESHAARTQEYPPVGGRLPEPRRPMPAPSKRASRVTAGATRRYFVDACYPGVLVAEVDAC